MPQAYQFDALGRAVLIGLSFEETEEFERLDDSLPYDGQLVWPPEDVPLLPMELRWLELYEKHQAAMPSKLPPLSQESLAIGLRRV